MASVGKRMDALTLRDDDASRKALEQAVAPTLTVLDDAQHSENNETRITAEHLRGDLYVAMAVRMRVTIPAGAPMQRHDTLETLIKPWLDHSQIAFSNVKSLAADHPETLRSPVVAAAVQASKTEIVARNP